MPHVVPSVQLEKSTMTAVLVSDICYFYDTRYRHIRLDACGRVGSRPQDKLAVECASFLLGFGCRVCGTSRTIKPITLGGALEVPGATCLVMPTLSCRNLSFLHICAWICEQYYVRSKGVTYQRRASSKAKERRGAYLNLIVFDCATE